MVKNGKQSDVTLRLLVDAAGKVTKCTSLSHFEDEEFNRISCARVSQRARFEPAELADGTKVPSYYTFRIKFRIG
jgi:protein TonB